MLQPLLRRVPSNLLVLIALFLFLLFFYYPNTRPFRQSTSSFSHYLNSSHALDSLGSLASELKLDCEPVIQSIITTEISTITSIQYLTATTTANSTQTCPVLPEVTAAPVDLPAKTAAQEPTTEKAIIARLRAQGIIIIFKTGAQEVSHLSIQVGTTLRYLDPLDILFFSDLQGSLGPFLINDALRNVDQSIKETHPDFEIYRAIRRYQRTGQDIEELKEERKKGNDRSGWRLDKYKFLHMVEETFEKRPDARWYVFIESDSYVLWDNLATWLGRLDSKKPMYLGAPVQVGGTAFGHGGSGYVLSNAAMNRLLGPDQPQGLAAEWDSKMGEVCCGDLALGIALKEKGVGVKGAHPLLNGEKPSTFSYGPREHWCQPVVTMHHVLPHEISAIWRYERRREMLGGDLNATIFADLYFHFVEPHLVAERDNWDNMSHGTTYSQEEIDKEEEEKKKVEEKKKKMEEEKKKVEEEKKKVEGGKKKAEEEKKKTGKEDGEGETLDKEPKKIGGNDEIDQAKEVQKAMGIKPGTKEKEIKEKVEAHKNEKGKGDEKKADGKKSENKANSIKPDEEKPVGKMSDEKESEERDPNEKKPDDKKPAGTRPEDENSKQKELNNKKPAEKKLSDKKTDEKTLSDKKPDDRKLDDKKAEEVPLKGPQGERPQDKLFEGRKTDSPKLSINSTSSQKSIAKLPSKRASKSSLEDIEKVAHLSFENCGKACEAKSECFQYVYSDKVCKLGHSVRLGKFVAPGKEEKVLWRSGWKVERIREWTEKHVCQGPVWPIVE